MEKAVFSIKKKHIGKDIYYMVLIPISDLNMTNSVAETCNLSLLQVYCEVKRV